MSGTAPHIAVAAGYMPFFDEIMPEGYPAGRDQYGRSIAEIVKAIGDVTYLGLIHNEEMGRAAGEVLSGLRADAVLLVPTMATPASYLWKVVEANPSLPVVIWAAYETGTVAPGYDMVELCQHSQNVGVLMVSNMLVRSGRPFVVIAGERDDQAAQAELFDALTVAALAGRLKRSRIGRLGRPLDGYSNVDVDAAGLKAATGIELIEIGLDEWNETLAGVSDNATQAVLQQVAARAEIDDKGQPEAVKVAGRMAAGLEEIARRYDLCAGAMNCRGEFGVTNAVCPSLGCLATTHATSIGIPFACTGDVITAIAMMAGRALGGAALYCELDAIDTARDAFLCANTGEGDLGWSDGQKDTCQIYSSGTDSGRSAPGCSVNQKLRAGPATMIGFTPHADAKGGFVLIAMEGEVQEPPQVQLSVSSAWFRANTQPMRKAFVGWAEAGATHHGSLSPGHQADRLELLARLLGIDFKRI